MRIIDVRHRSVPVSRYAAEISVPTVLDTTIVAVLTDLRHGGEPIVGYGFASIGRFAQGGLIEERFAPRLLKAEPQSLMHMDGAAIDSALAWKAMMAGEKPGGHGERCIAVGALEMAIWDACAKARGLPLCTLLAREFTNGEPLQPLPAYAGGGYYFPDNDLGRLRAEAQYFRSLGFTSAKIKIGAADVAADCKRIEAVLDVLRHGGDLAVDAMNSYSADRALEAARTIEPYGLRWFEDICDPLDYEIHATVARAYRPPISAGEALFSLADARNLQRYGGLRPGHDVLAFDPAHCYGITEFVRVVRHFEAHGWSTADFQSPRGSPLWSARCSRLAARRLRMQSAQLPAVRGVL
jgi:L-alanine-DL-glutamate epimerase-like enolase superfamily enzyme